MPTLQSRPQGPEKIDESCHRGAKLMLSPLIQEEVSSIKHRHTLLRLPEQKPAPDPLERVLSHQSLGLLRFHPERACRHVSSGVLGMPVHAVGHMALEVFECISCR